MAKKILVIDDDLTGVALLRTRLSKAGYDVVAAANGAMGLNAVASEHPDMVILDIEMPQMNGYTFIMELRKVDKARVIPVIVTTSREEHKMLFYRHGIKDYLVKPVNVDELITKIQAIIGQP